MKRNEQTNLYDQNIVSDMIDILQMILQRLNQQSSQALQYYDSADVKQLLNISDSTLYRMRKVKEIPFFKIGKKIYYPRLFFNQNKL